MYGNNGNGGEMGSFKKAQEAKGSLFVVVRLVHFIGGAVASQPISFHATESEATAAKDRESAELGRIYKSDKRFEALFTRLGIAAISFNVGEFKTEQANLIEVPRLVIPAH